MEILQIYLRYFHPQALAQCSEWLAENSRAITLPTNSTSEAVNMVKGVHLEQL